jgi:hypothetical protein
VRRRSTRSSLAAALLEAGIERRVVVVAGGSLAKLGMKFEAR